MLARSVWSREFLELSGRKGAFAAEAALPLALALPLLAGPPHLPQAALLSSIIVLTSVLHAAARAHFMVRSGLAQRLARMPVPPYRLFFQTIIARSFLGFVRLLPLLLAMEWRYRATPTASLSLAALCLPSLVVAELAGALAGSFARTAGDVWLHSLVLALPALFLSGVFGPDGDPAGWQFALSELFPFTFLHRAMLQMIRPFPGPFPSAVIGPAVWSAAGWMGVAMLELRRRIARMG
jgi:hypothetical protein